MYISPSLACCALMCATVITPQPGFVASFNVSKRVADVVSVSVMGALSS